MMPTSQLQLPRWTAAAVCDAVARGSLLTATILLPWSFGGVDAFSQYLMFVFLVVAEAAFLLRLLLAGSTSTTIPTVAIPAAVLIAWGFLQTLDVGPGAVANLSPQAAALRSQLLDDGEPRESDEPRAHTLSLYAPATRKETALLLAGLAVLLLARHVFAQPREVLWLASALAINGAAIAYLGIMQKLSWNGQIYWSVPTEGSTPFGPFVNRNGGGGYLVLCLAGTIPWLARIVGKFPTDKPDDSARRSMPRRTWFRLPHEAVWLALGVAVVLLLGGLMASMSRGAWLGAVCGAAATIGLVGRSSLRRGGLVWLMVGLIVAAVLLSWLNLQTELGDRLSSLSQTEHTLSGRWNLWRDAVRIVPDFWQVGSGLGTFGFVQPQYQTGPMRVWFDQAENLFLQAFVEAGVGGGLLLIAVVVLALSSLRPLWRAADDPIATAVAGFAVFAIVGQVACASFDFSLRYPANQWALALVVGSALGFADQQRRTSALPNQTVSMTRRLAASGLHAVLLVGLLAAWWEVAWSGGVDLALVRGETEFDEQGMSTEDIDDTLTGLRILLQHRPDDAEARLRVAGLLVVRYRQQAFEQLQAELGTELPDAELWALTAPQVLHARAAEFALTADTVSLDELRAEPIIHEQLLPALQQTGRARQTGPLLPGTHRLLAQLQFLTDDPLHDAPHIRRATRLMPQNPEVRHWAGRMHWDAGRVPEALVEWQRCLSLAVEYDDDILETVAETVPVERIITDLLPDSPAALLRIADRPAWLDLETDARTRLGDKLQRMLDSTPAASLPAGEWEFAQGRTAQLHYDLEAARPHLQRATALDPERIEWRLMLAIVLRDLGETRDAIREVQACARLDPDNPVAQALLQSLIAAELERPRRVAP